MHRRSFLRNTGLPAGMSLLAQREAIAQLFFVVSPVADSII